MESYEPKTILAVGAILWRGTLFLSEKAVIYRTRHGDELYLP